MLAPDQFLAFLLAAILLTASPGPDNLMVLGLGMSKGRRPGMVFGLGCALGCLSHTLLAVVGVSAAIAANPAAFDALRIGGGVYLVWLGIGALRSQGGATASKDVAPHSLRKLFMKGLLANAINPKVVLFFLSLLPQFVVPANGNVPGQMLALGVTFTVQAAVLFGLLGYFAGAIGAWLERQPGAGKWLDRLAGTVFIGLGAKLILSR
ncbi:LysE family translocator [Massilia sp. Dwa41.01b]|uniref:LysE family translocator n=1 Tax=unclassified Massilia TaxID=2609279 RepID=UPI0016031BC6|nr:MULTISPECIES: LysE family translocator [unclassified Massilia]QNA89922.1 LysE family translocator [Massilia sp. Dwa41.01b]QNB00807.1 LysE family translocator [Massilia sp. Se16.2.3]